MMLYVRMDNIIIKTNNNCINIIIKHVISYLFYGYFINNDI